MWTPVTRRQHSRTGLRYETDLTDAEWAVIEPLLPPPPKRGRPRFWPMREIMDAIFYVLRGGIAWRLLPTGPTAQEHGLSLVRSLARHGSVPETRTICSSWLTESRSDVRRRPAPP